MPSPKLCPTCKQPLPQTPHKRMCDNCHQPIGRHDKWLFVTVEGQTRVMHRDCENPTQYKTEDKKEALNQMELQ